MSDRVAGRQTSDQRIAAQKQQPTAAEATAPPEPPAGPVEAGERINSVDVLRGMALLGILLVRSSERHQLYYLVPGVWAVNLVVSPVCCASSTLAP